MHYEKSIKKVIDGKTYSAETATLLASDEYWDGSNFERNGRNNFLLRTPDGYYFEIVVTRWSDEHDVINPLTETEADEIYECLSVHVVDYETAFPERAKRTAAAQMMGRKGGQATSARKAAAVRENGKLGGRPRKDS